MVSIDPYVNETTRHAHVILPPASSLTEEHMDFFFATFSIRNVTRVSPPVMERRPGERHDWEIMLSLAEGLGGGLLGIPPLDFALRLLRRAGVDVTPGHVANALLRTGTHGDRFLPFSKGLNRSKLSAAAHGVDLGPLEAGVHRRVTHRDRRVHVDAPPLVEALEAFAQSGPPARESGELLLIGRRDVRSNNSWMHNLPSLAGGKDRCVLLVSPDDAQRAGLRTGDTAWLESRVHGGVVPVRVSDEMRPGVVSLPHGWGHAAAAPYQRTAGSRPGVSVNDWADDSDVESVVGQSILNGVAVRLRRLEQEVELSPTS
jgi:anaerobic selenocysteine-containing dehydrogenase